MVFIHFYARFSSKEGRRSNSLAGLGIPHGQQQFQIILLAPHQNGTKQSLRGSHFTLALDELWAGFPWV